MVAHRQKTDGFIGYTPSMRLATSWLCLASTAPFVLTTPKEASAAPPPPTLRTSRPYLQVSPGFAALLIAERRFSSDARWAWPWSLGAGAEFTGRHDLRATIGASLEHRILVVDGARPHGLHALVEARLGTGSARVWGYGLAGVGLATTLIDWSGPKTVEDFYGVAIELGGGLRGMIGARAFVGGEVDLDLDYYMLANHKIARLDDFQYHTLSFEIYVGRIF